MFESQEEYNANINAQGEAEAEANMQMDMEADHQRSIDELVLALKSTRQQSTYISLKEIVNAIKEAFPEEYQKIGEELLVNLLKD